MNTFPLPMAGVAVVKQPARALVAKHGARHDGVGILSEELAEVNGRAATSPGDVGGQRDGLLLPDIWPWRTLPRWIGHSTQVEQQDLAVRTRRGRLRAVRQRITSSSFYDAWAQAPACQYEPAWTATSAKPEAKTTERG